MIGSHTVGGAAARDIWFVPIALKKCVGCLMWLTNIRIEDKESIK